MRINLIPPNECVPIIWHSPLRYKLVMMKISSPFQIFSKFECQQKLSNLWSTFPSKKLKKFFRQEEEKDLEFLYLSSEVLISKSARLFYIKFSHFGFPPNIERTNIFLSTGDKSLEPWEDRKCDAFFQLTTNHSIRFSKNSMIKFYLMKSYPIEPSVLLMGLFSLSQSF